MQGTFIFLHLRCLFLSLSIFSMLADLYKTTVTIFLVVSETKIGETKEKLRN